MSDNPIIIRPAEVPDTARERIEVSPRTGLTSVLWTWMEDGRQRGYRLQLPSHYAPEYQQQSRRKQELERLKTEYEAKHEASREPASLTAQRDLTEAELLDPSLFVQEVYEEKL